MLGGWVLPPPPLPPLYATLSLLYLTSYLGVAAAACRQSKTERRERERTRRVLQIFSSSDQPCPRLHSLESLESISRVFTGLCRHLTDCDIYIFSHGCCCCSRPQPKKQWVAVPDFDHRGLCPRVVKAREKSDSTPGSVVRVFLTRYVVNRCKQKSIMTETGQYFDLCTVGSPQKVNIYLIFLTY